MFRIQSGDWWLFPLIYGVRVSSIAAVAIGSLTPGVKLPSRFWNADKWVRLCAYLWLALLPKLIVKSQKRILNSSIGLILLGCILEFGQMYVPGRRFSLADRGASTAGVFLDFPPGKRCRFRLWRALSVKG